MPIMEIALWFPVTLTALMAVFWVIEKVIERSDRKYRRRLVAESDARIQALRDDWQLARDQGMSLDRFIELENKRD